MHIEKQTLDFLQQLRKNNDREWFRANRDAYDAARENVKAVITALIAEMAKFDPQISTDIQAAKCLFRIYRDTRFARDKTPYKTWFGAGISVDGHKLPGPVYYLHIEPGKCQLACGYWHPEKAHRDAIRQEIDYNAPELEEALKAGGRTLADLSAEDKLKRPPAGYAADDPNIELLKLKSFIIYRHFSDAEITDKKVLKQLSEAARSMFPFKRFLHGAILAED